MNRKRALAKLHHLQEENQQKLRTFELLDMAPPPAMEMLAIRMDFLTYQLGKKWGEAWALQCHIEFEELLNELFTLAIEQKTGAKREDEGVGQEQGLDGGVSGRPERGDLDTDIQHRPEH